jgi:3-oxoacyl-[acyl-carrier protein] reductase
VTGGHGRGVDLDLDLAGRAAIVTGAGGGIGRAVAEHLAEAGVSVGVVDVNGGAAGGAASGITASGGRAAAVRADVASPGDAETAVRTVLQAFGRIDILVNCAGIYPFSPALDMTVDEWERVIGVNLTGAFLLSRQVLPIMVERRFGRIINICSGHAYRGGTGHAHYAASKAGLLGLTRALAREMGPYGIRVNAIVPSVTDTAMPRQHHGEDYLHERARGNPAGRIGSPSDIALGVVYLSSRWAEYVNGHALMITGGDLM